EPVVTIAHRMEAAIRLIDPGARGLPAGFVDALLDGLRAISTRVRAVADRKPVPAPPASLLAALDSLDQPRVEGMAPGAARRMRLDAGLAAKIGPIEHEQ